MTDDIHKALLGGNKPYRRKRVHEGKTWREQDPPTMQEVHRGVWCRRCRVRHPYNGSDRVKLKTAYEKRGKVFVLLWICPNTGDVVGELYLGGQSERGSSEGTA